MSHVDPNYIFKKRVIKGCGRNDEILATSMKNRQFEDARATAERRRTSSSGVGRGEKPVNAARTESLTLDASPGRMKSGVSHQLPRRLGAEDECNTLPVHCKAPDVSTFQECQTVDHQSKPSKGGVISLFGESSSGSAPQRFSFVFDTLRETTDTSAPPQSAHL